MNCWRHVTVTGGELLASAGVVYRTGTDLSWSCRWSRPVRWRRSGSAAGPSPARLARSAPSAATGRRRWPDARLTCHHQPPQTDATGDRTRCPPLKTHRQMQSGPIIANTNTCTITSADVALDFAFLTKHKREVISYVRDRVHKMYTIPHRTLSLTIISLILRGYQRYTPTTSTLSVCKKVVKDIPDNIISLY